MDDDYFSIQDSSNYPFPEAIEADEVKEDPEEDLHTPGIRNGQKNKSNFF